MGYPHVTDLNLSYNSFNNAKPNPPLIPMLNNGACSLPNAAIISPCYGCPNPTILLTLNHEINSNERSKAEFCHEQQPLGSSRWNPTPEQLLALEELYRRGTRTPSAAQIQQIATRLRRFGKIEGKNVFYWFQNHKARERQKRRRELETEQPPPLPPQQHVKRQQEFDTEKSLEKKESAFSLPLIELIKDKGPPSNSSNLSEEFISTQGWMQIKEKELQRRRSSVGKVLNDQILCSFKTHQENINITTLDDENSDDQTLELFPLGSHDRNGINIAKKDTTKRHIRAINTTFKSNQYFEFLPLKN